MGISSALFFYSSTKYLDRMMNW